MSRCATGVRVLFQCAEKILQVRSWQSIATNVGSVPQICTAVSSSTMQKFCCQRSFSSSPEAFRENPGNPAQPRQPPLETNEGIFDHDTDPEVATGLALEAPRLRGEEDGEGFGLGATMAASQSTTHRGNKAIGPPAEEFEQWSRNFKVKVVDVNRTSRGSPTGGIGRFSAIVVVGNGNGVIGFGSGKSEAMGEAVKKANRQALKTLFYVPRYNNATIMHPVVAKFGKCKVTMYPRSTGAGCKASHLMSDICKLAGIQDIGIKTHGTRNLRNTVKALIRGFESQLVPEEWADLPLETGSKSPIEQQRRRIRGVPTRQTAGLISIPRP